MRIERGLTQKELAEKLKIDQSAVAQWERGKCGPKRKRLAEVADVLECSVEELLKEDAADSDRPLSPTPEA